MPNPSVTHCIHRENGRRCPRTARYFGRWAGGGVCDDHVKGLEDELHAEDRRRLDAWRTVRRWRGLSA